MSGLISKQHQEVWELSSFIHRNNVHGRTSEYMLSIVSEPMICQNPHWQKCLELVKQEMAWTPKNPSDYSSHQQVGTPQLAGSRPRKQMSKTKPRLSGASPQQTYHPVHYVVCIHFYTYRIELFSWNVNANSIFLQFHFVSNTHLTSHGFLQLLPCSFLSGY